MKTLHEFGEAIIQIREALTDLKIEATPNNCTICLFCNKKCNELIAAINNAAQTAPPGDIEVNLDVNMEHPELEKEDANGDD